MADANAELIAQLLDFVPTDGTVIGNGDGNRKIAVKILDGRGIESLR